MLVGHCLQLRVDRAPFMTQPFHASAIFLHHCIFRDGDFSLAESWEEALPQVVKREFWGVEFAFSAKCKLEESHLEMRVLRVHC